MSGSKKGERRGGRKRGQPNKITGEAKMRLRDMARVHTEKAMKTVIKNLDNKNPLVRQRAADSILDRGWGKPGQTIMFGDDDPDAKKPRNELVVRFVRAANQKD